MANSVDPDQTAPIGAVWSRSKLFASILNSSVMLGNYLQQMTSAEDIFRCIFFLGALRVKDILCGNSSYSFILFPLKLYKYLGHGLKMCILFGYNPQKIFVTFFSQAELSHFPGIITFQVNR